MKRQIAEAPDTPRTSFPQFRVLDGWCPRFDRNDALDEFWPCIRSHPTGRRIPRVHKRNDRFADQIQQSYESFRKEFLLIVQDMLDFGLSVIIKYRVADFAFLRCVAWPLRVLIPLRPSLRHLRSRRVAARPDLLH